MADTGNFLVTCENKGSYEIRMTMGRYDRVLPKPVVLIRCDRINLADNERGLRLANIICDSLNQLDDDTAASLVGEDMKSGKFKKKMRSARVNVDNESK